MAVLVRINRMADPIRRALHGAGIPYVSVGMSTLFDAPEAEAARQLFHLVCRPRQIVTGKPAGNRPPPNLQVAG